ncbi:MAG TPA: ABC transporter permease [Steroidobacteraceae bacterium]|nr:ABC transporter permease [Steroidobacteraceae bacterium]
MSIPKPAGPAPSNAWALKARRLRALVMKEMRQILRDPSSIAIGVVLPLMLILLFGYGLSLDVKNVPIALVVENPTPEALELAGGFELSPYFRPVILRSTAPAQQLLLEHRVDGIVTIPQDFSRRFTLGNAQVQLIVHGGDANRARITQGYVQGVIGLWSARAAAEGRASPMQPVGVEARLWFNEANDSSYFLVPGLVVLVMTLIGGLLTAMVMAREWERGTFEALLVTPVRSEEILLGKTLPNFALALVGFALCVVSAKFLFHVPLRGSIWVLLGASMLYVLIALGIGLSISSWVKSQLVASQLTMLATFLPAFMLSGFLFDLRSMPTVVRWITYALPARYYVALLQSVFLAGDVWSVIVPNTLALVAMTAALTLGSRAAMRKQLA